MNIVWQPGLCLAGKRNPALLPGGYAMKPLAYQAMTARFGVYVKIRPDILQRRARRQKCPEWRSTACLIKQLSASPISAFSASP